MLVVHIGAGNHQANKAKYQGILKKALDHDFLTASEIIEKSQWTNTGYGSNPDWNGSASCDGTLASVNHHNKVHVTLLTEIIDCAVPTRALDAVAEKLHQLYSDGLVRGHLGLVRPVSMPFALAREIVDLPREPILLHRGRKYYESVRSVLALEHLAGFGAEMGAVSTNVAANTTDVAFSGTDKREADFSAVSSHVPHFPVADTVGFIESSPALRFSTTSGGHMLRFPGRTSCAGIYGAGSGYACLGDAEVVTLCSGNGDDIITMGLASHVSDHMAAAATAGEVLAETLQRIVLSRAQLVLSCYVGVLCVVRGRANSARKSTLVYCHTTETFYFGFRSSAGTEVVLSKGKRGLCVGGEFRLGA